MLHLSVSFLLVKSELSYILSISQRWSQIYCGWLPNGYIRLTKRRRSCVYLSNEDSILHLYPALEFRKVLHYPNPTSMAAIQTAGKKVFNKFVIQFESALFSYSLDLIARVALGQAHPQTLDASLEKIAGNDTNILFFRHAYISQRSLSW